MVALGHSSPHAKHSAKLGEWDPVSRARVAVFRVGSYSRPPRTTDWLLPAAVEARLLASTWLSRGRTRPGPAELRDASAAFDHRREATTSLHGVRRVARGRDGVLPRWCSWACAPSSRVMRVLVASARSMTVSCSCLGSTRWRSFRLTPSPAVRDGPERPGLGTGAAPIERLLDAGGHKTGTRTHTPVRPTWRFLSAAIRRRTFVRTKLVRACRLPFPLGTCRHASVPLSALGDSRPACHRFRLHDVCVGVCRCGPAR